MCLAPPIYRSDTLPTDNVNVHICSYMMLHFTHYPSCHGFHTLCFLKLISSMKWNLISFLLNSLDVGWHWRCREKKQQKLFMPFIRSGMRMAMTLCKEFSRSNPLVGDRQAICYQIVRMQACPTTCQLENAHPTIEIPQYPHNRLHHHSPTCSQTPQFLPIQLAHSARALVPPRWHWLRPCMPSVHDLWPTTRPWPAPWLSRTASLPRGPC